MGDNRNTDWVCGFLLYIPGNWHSPLCITLQFLCAYTVGRVDGDSSPTGNIPDDTVSWQWMTAAGKADQYIIQAVDLDAILTRHRPRGREGFAFLAPFLQEVGWQETVHDLLRRNAASASGLR